MLLSTTATAKRHNNVASIIYRAICAEYDLEHSNDWWVEPEKVVRNDYVKILWDFPIQTDKHLLHNRPDIMLINYKEQTGLIIDMQCQEMKTSRTRSSKKLTNISH